MKCVKCLFVLLVSLLFIFSFSSFLLFSGRRQSRDFLYHHIVKNRVIGVRLGMRKTRYNSVEAVRDYVDVMIARPPSVFFKTLFGGLMNVETVQIVDRKVYVRLSKVASNDSQETESLIKSDVMLLGRGILKNFPFFSGVVVFVEGDEYSYRRRMSSIKETKV